jgi:hypothetical protein
LESERIFPSRQSAALKVKQRFTRFTMLSEMKISNATFVASAVQRFSGTYPRFRNSSALLVGALLTVR